MRLWHIDLIPILPDRQLLSQWRECCAIAKNIADDGNPNHLLVNKVLEYPVDHLYSYALLVIEEMMNRGFHLKNNSYENFIHNLDKFGFYTKVPIDYIFGNWHNMRYFIQCFYNLQEKYDCGGISDEEWKRIENRYLEITDQFCA